MDEDSYVRYMLVKSGQVDDHNYVNETAVQYCTEGRMAQTTVQCCTRERTGRLLSAGDVHLASRWQLHVRIGGVGAVDDDDCLQVCLCNMDP